MPKNETLEVKSKKANINVSVNYTFPETVAEAITMYGEDVVHNRLIRQINQEVRASILRAATNAKEKKQNVQAAAENAVASFKPLVVTEVARAERAAAKALEGLSPEAREAVLRAIAGSNSNGASNDGPTMEDALASA